MQGALNAAGRPLLTPADARALLRATGTPQQDGPAGPASQRIGSRPDVREMLSMVLPFAGREEAFAFPSNYEAEEMIGAGIP